VDFCGCIWTLCSHSQQSLSPVQGLNRSSSRMALSILQHEFSANHINFLGSQLYWLHQFSYSHTACGPWKWPFGVKRSDPKH
jgi:hypothetical protein